MNTDHLMTQESCIECPEERVVKKLIRDQKKKIIGLGNQKQALKYYGFSGKKLSAC